MVPRSTSCRQVAAPECKGLKKALLKIAYCTPWRSQTHKTDLIKRHRRWQLEEDEMTGAMGRELQVSSAPRPLDSPTVQDLPPGRASAVSLHRASAVSGPFRYYAPATEPRTAPERRTSILQRITSSVAWPDPSVPSFGSQGWKMVWRAAWNMWSLSMSGETSYLCKV